MPLYSEKFSKLLADACVKILPKDSNRFNDDHIRLSKILGGSIEDSMVLRGLVVNRSPESSNHDLSTLKNVKVAVFNCPFDPNSGETKGTVLFKNKDELLNYNTTEEDYAKKLAEQVVASGAKVLIVGGSISELCLHYLNSFGVFVLRIMSKFELKRICKALNASPLASLGQPSQEELGFVDLVEVKEIGSTKVVLLHKDNENTKLVSLILRGPTNTLLDDLERSLANGVSAFKQMLDDARYVPGACSTEAYLYNTLESYGNKLTGMEQYSVTKFAQAFEGFIRVLSGNAGLDPNTSIPDLLSKNVEGAKSGVDVLNGALGNNEDLKVFDSLSCKMNAIRLATQTAMTILRIDQIIMSKPAGGPKPKSNSGWDNH